MAHPERFELPTKWFEATYSIQLSYGCGQAAHNTAKAGLRLSLPKFSWRNSD